MGLWCVWHCRSPNVAFVFVRFFCVLNFEVLSPSVCVRDVSVLEWLVG